MDHVTDTKLQFSISRNVIGKNLHKVNLAVGWRPLVSADRETALHYLTKVGPQLGHVQRSTSSTQEHGEMRWPWPRHR